MFEPQRDHRLVDLRRPAAAAIRVTAVEQQLGDLLRDRGAAFDDAALGEVGLERAQHAIGSTPGCDQKRRSSAAIVAATSVGGKVGCERASSARAIGARASYRGTPWRSTTIVDGAGSSSRPEGSGPSRSHNAVTHASRCDTAIPSFQRGSPQAVQQPAESAVGAWRAHRFTSIIVVAVRPKISGVYISSARAGAVRKDPGGGGAGDVAELVDAFAQPGGEQLDAIVVTLDVIEAAGAEPVLPVVASPAGHDRWSGGPAAPPGLRRWSRTRTRPPRSRPAADRVTATNRRSFVSRR